MPTATLRRRPEERISERMRKRFSFVLKTAVTKLKEREIKLNGKIIKTATGLEKELAIKALFGRLNENDLGIKIMTLGQLYYARGNETAGKIIEKLTLGIEKEAKKEKERSGILILTELRTIERLAKTNWKLIDATETKILEDMKRLEAARKIAEGFIEKGRYTEKADGMYNRQAVLTLQALNLSLQALEKALKAKRNHSQGPKGRAKEYRKVA